MLERADFLYMSRYCLFANKKELQLLLFPFFSHSLQVVLWIERAVLQLVT